MKMRRVFAGLSAVALVTPAGVGAIPTNLMPTHGHGHAEAAVDSSGASLVAHLEQGDAKDTLIRKEGESIVAVAPGDKKQKGHQRHAVEVDS